jgi:hypothetical protein
METAERIARQTFTRWNTGETMVGAWANTIKGLTAQGVAITPYTRLVARTHLRALVGAAESLAGLG